MVKIGMVQGSGAGAQMRSILLNTLDTLAGSGSYEPVICSHRGRSYTEMKAWKSQDFEQAVEDDIAALARFYESFYDQGGRVLFRGPINAEPLYVHRNIYDGVKVVPFTSQGRSILLVRDMTQGFYANENWEVGDEVITFSGSYHKDKFQRVLTFAKDQAKDVLREGYDTWVVYKHHLFATALEHWAREVGDELELSHHITQPGASNDRLGDYLESEDGNDLLLVMANEIADIEHEYLIRTDPRVTRNTAIAKSFYLSERLSGLVEWQTVHGSADEVADTQRFNPLATLRAGAALCEEVLGKSGSVERIEERIRDALSKGLVDERLRAAASTDDIVSFALK